MPAESIGPVPDEICDGQDNDCDDAIDEGVQMRAVNAAHCLQKSVMESIMIAMAS